MKDFDAVIFDMDGVIFDSERTLMSCWGELADKYGISHVKETYLACLGVTRKKTEEIVKAAYGPDFPFEKYWHEAWEIYFDKYGEGRLPVKPGVRGIMQFLKKEGKKIALASSTARPIVLRELGEAGLLESFDEIVTGDMVTHSKPDPEIFLLACEKLSVLPERSYAVEDSFNGIRAAHCGGLRPIMVPDLLAADEEMKGLAEAVLGSLNDVIAYLQA